MPNRLTFMERMSERITALESVLKKLEPVENILERMDLLEKSIYSTKRVFTFQDACMYIGVSDSMLYKLTANKEIPHYKPRGKMIYLPRKTWMNGFYRTMNRLQTMPYAWRPKLQRHNHS